MESGRVAVGVPSFATPSLGLSFISAPELSTPGLRAEVSIVHGMETGDNRRRTHKRCHNRTKLRILPCATYPAYAPPWSTFEPYYEHTSNLARSVRPHCSPGLASMARRTGDGHLCDARTNHSHSDHIDTRSSKFNVSITPARRQSINSAKQANKKTLGVSSSATSSLGLPHDIAPELSALASYNEMTNAIE